MKKPGVCKYCGASIYFVHTLTRMEDGERKVGARPWPVDAEPSATGNVTLAWNAALKKVLAVVSAKPVEGGRLAHHFTCKPEAAPSPQDEAPDEQLRAKVEWFKEDDKWGLEGWRWEVARRNGSATGFEDTEDDAWRAANEAAALLKALEEGGVEEVKEWRIAALRVAVAKLRAEV